MLSNLNLHVALNLYQSSFLCFCIIWREVFQQTCIHDDCKLIILLSFLPFPLHFFFYQISIMELCFWHVSIYRGLCSPRTHLVILLCARISLSQWSRLQETLMSGNTNQIGKGSREEIAFPPWFMTAVQSEEVVCHYSDLIHNRNSKQGIGMLHFHLAFTTAIPRRRSGLFHANHLFLAKVYKISKWTYHMTVLRFCDHVWMHASMQIRSQRSRWNVQFLTNIHGAEVNYLLVDVALNSVLQLEQTRKCLWNKKNNHWGKTRSNFRHCQPKWIMQWSKPSSWR